MISGASPAFREAGFTVDEEKRCRSATVALPSAAARAWERNFRYEALDVDPCARSSYGKRQIEVTRSDPQNVNGVVFGIKTKTSPVQVVQNQSNLEERYLHELR